MGIKRASHAVYDAKYHLVWAPKYRKWVLREDIRGSIGKYFEEISKAYEFEIEEMEMAKDHVHIFLGFPPRYSISRVVAILKGRSASRVFREHPEVKQELWGGEFWEDGHFARTVGDKVTQELIRKYIEYHSHNEKTLNQTEFDF